MQKISLLASAIVASVGTFSASTALAAKYLLIVPVMAGSTAPEPVTVKLTGTELPTGIGQKPYQHNLSTYLSVGNDKGGAQAAKWRVVSGNFPAGLVLSDNGDLTGIPVQIADNEEITVEASYKGAADAATYRITVSEVIEMTLRDIPTISKIVSDKPITVDLNEYLEIKGATPYDNNELYWGGGAGADGKVSLSGLLTYPANKLTIPTNIPIYAGYKNEQASGVIRFDVDNPPYALKSISIGDYHSCGITMSDGVVCWGFNRRGQLGNGSEVTSARPVIVPSLTNIKQVSAGGESTCAVTSGGDLYCWGGNSYGQLGIGTTVDSAYPVKVSNMPDVSSVFVGGVSACAIANSGGLKCWGANAVPDDTYVRSVSIPTAILDGLGAFKQVAIATWDKCALTTQGSTYCWGSGLYPSKAKIMDDLPKAKAISVGNSNICAHAMAGSISCFSSQPGKSFDVSGDFVSFDQDPSGSTYCVITNSGSAQCAGYGAMGQLGQGNTQSSVSLLPLYGVSDQIAQIELGASFGCLRTVENIVKCWGTDYNGAHGFDESVMRAPRNILTPN